MKQGGTCCQRLDAIEDLVALSDLVNDEDLATLLGKDSFSAFVDCQPATNQSARRQFSVHVGYFSMVQ